MFQADVLAGRTILVTGGGTGLGRAMTLRFAELGAKVAVVGRRTAPLEETVGLARERGAAAAWASVDVRDAAAVKAAVDEVEGALGPVTDLVNNAAGNFLATTEDLSPNAFDAVVRIVLHGTFHCTNELGRRWIAREAGKGGVHPSVLSIVTTYAWMGSAFVVPSACAKAGVLALMRSLAVEWGTYGIRLNAIAPGPFPTEGAFSRLMAAPGMEEAAKQRNPLGRFGEPPELADLATFLLSPMARYVNGEVVVIDGGEWLKAGQEFGHIADVPREQVRQLVAALKPSK